MKRMKQIGIAVLTSLFLTSTISPMTWAQTAQPATSEASTGQDVAAGFINVVYVPGKAIACAGTFVLGVGAMALSLGGVYKDAAHFIGEGCGGKWIVRGKDLSSS